MYNPATIPMKVSPDLKQQGLKKLLIANYGCMHHPVA